MNNHPAASTLSIDTPENFVLAPSEANHLYASSLENLQAQTLVQAFRLYGYRRAYIDPLGLIQPMLVPELELGFHGLDTSSAQVLFTTDFAAELRNATLPHLVQRLHQVYCSSIGLECGHIRSHIRRKWLLNKMESRVQPSALATEQRLATLGHLVAAQSWEHYLNQNYMHSKRFSLEGCESLIALLNTISHNAGRHGANKIMMGMPHRGRLNVLVNVMGYPAQQMLSFFNGSAIKGQTEFNDLKYHLGYRSVVETAHGAVSLFMPHNPLHLESVGPVLCGMARAEQDQDSDALGKHSVPILMHGDAAFCGQGVVMETLNLSQTRGYSVGGTVHIVINNQIGFTTSDPRDSRSSLYATDIARTVDAPVIHVNADDPDSVCFAANLALEYRMTFGADIVIDLVGYRRLGHNELDVPSLTQPLMQKTIDQHPDVVSIYAEQLARAGIVSEETLSTMRTSCFETLAAADQNIEALRPQFHVVRETDNFERRSMWRLPVKTAIPQERLQQIVNSMITLPEKFVPHPDIQAMIQCWTTAVSQLDHHIDWRLAENLAFASLLADQFSIRMSGIDARRGTFFHRHGAWHSQCVEGFSDLRTYVPLRHAAPVQGEFDLFDSPLSESAVLGFEYGYSVQTARELVIWEAQYGDFVNNAQVIIDQYIASGESKWGYKSGLTVLLPHGHEGVGPEHSNAYLGRFLQLCAEDNLRVAVPSTSAQMFHLLRRQGMVHERKPLIVFTPKSELYMQEKSHAAFEQFTAGEFRPVLADDTVLPSQVEQVVITSGKLYYDLATERINSAQQNTAIVRLEQLYPFPRAELRQQLEKYPGVRKVIWAQEEQKNHGAWQMLQDDLRTVVPEGAVLQCQSRPASAASAVSCVKTHVNEQRSLVHAVFA